MRELTLSAPGLDDLVLTDFVNGWSVREFEWAPAPIRTASQPAPDADGEIDSSTLRGAATITIGFRLVSTVYRTQWMVDALRAFCHGAVRPTLTIGDEDWPFDRIARLSQGVVTSPHHRPPERFAVAQFKVPTGTLESGELHTASANASGGGAVTGREYDLEFDRVYPAGMVEGSVVVVNAGSADAYPLVRLYGPWSDETALINDVSGRRLVFDGLSVLADQFLEIDFRGRTIRLNGDATQSRYDRLVPALSSWWTVRPGTQRIRFVPGTFTSPANAQISWRDAWL